MVYDLEAAATSGTYLAVAPVKAGRWLFASVMEKTSVGRVLKGLRGSFKSVKGSSPVLVIIASTLKFSMSVTTSGAIKIAD